MLKKLLVGSAFGLLLSVGTVCAADVIVKVAPPAAVVETRPVSPGPNYVWIGGYQKWDGNAYVWVPGRWDVPPRPGARWVAHRWVHRGGGWVFVEGRWR
jgi:WXXGXW repeat (2 copies)